MDVLCLEQGDWPDRADYPGPKPDWELQAMKQWAPDPNVRGRPGRLPDRRLGVRHRAADVQRRRRLDGALRRRLAAPDAVRLPRQIARRRRRRLAADVRGARAVLRPHRPPGRRRRASRATRPTRRAPTCRCPRCRSAAASWTSCARTTGSAGTGGRRRARSSRAPYAGRHPCAQWGSCMQGCPEGAKASTDVTHWPQAIARGARVLTGARATRLLLGPDGLVTGAEYVDAEGRTAPRGGGRRRARRERDRHARGCCSSRPARRSRTASRTPAAWSGGA